MSFLWYIFSHCFPGLCWLDNLWLHRVDNVNENHQFASLLLTWPKAAQRGKGLCGIPLRLPSVHARKMRAGSQQEVRPGAAHLLVPSDWLSNLIPPSRALPHQSLIRTMPCRPVERRQILHCGSLFPGVSSLCHVAITSQHSMERNYTYLRHYKMAWNKSVGQTNVFRWCIFLTFIREDQRSLK